MLFYPKKSLFLSRLCSVIASKHIELNLIALKANCQGLKRLNREGEGNVKIECSRVNRGDQMGMNVERQLRNHCYLLIFTIFLL